MIASYDVKFSAACAPPRLAIAILMRDATDPKLPEPDEIAGYAFIEDATAGEVTRRIDFGPYPGGLGALSLDGPAAATQHHFDINLQVANCSSGTGTDVVGALLDVIGTK